MASKSKYRKLNLGPSEPLTRRNSVQGMFVMADYIDPLTAQRTLLLERQAAEAVVEPKPRAKHHKRGYKTNTQPEPIDTMSHNVGVAYNG